MPERSLGRSAAVAGALSFLGAGSVAWMSISLRSVASEAAAALPDPKPAT